MGPFGCMVALHGAPTRRRWIKEYDNEADPMVFPGKGNQHPANEGTREIRRRMHDLEQENANLKKGHARLFQRRVMR